MRCSTQGEIRLEGRDDHVEVCNDGRWGAVCGDSGWDNNAATVACRQLNLPFTGKKIYHTIKIVEYYHKTKS